ncbi:hypothetical protein OROMI_025220 [Orobanche minor]
MIGIDVPLIELRFEHLKIEVEAHVGSTVVPSFLNFNISIVEGLMILLLGPPSSGKTTLLLALAGKLDPTLKFSGRVTYNGHEMTEFVPKRTAAYISQHDLRIREMIVRETLAISARYSSKNKELRKCLLLGSQGARASEIDIDNLGTEERKKILQRLVNVAEEDNEKFLLKLRDRVDKVGIDLSLIEVKFEHLKIEAKAHVGSRAELYLAENTKVSLTIISPMWRSCWLIGSCSLGHKFSHFVAIRKKILLRLVNVAEEDNEKFLLKHSDRVDRIGIDLPLIEVRFEHLKIEAKAHVGSRVVPSFLSYTSQKMPKFL